MKSLFKSALASLLISLPFTVMADAELDSLLNKIDADISAKRLSTPAGNNAIEKIWQFKDRAPYDQRINSRAYKVGKSYVKLANNATASKQFSKAQSYLDNAWMLAFLTPGLDAAQDKLDKLYNSKAVAKKAPAKKATKQVAKATTKKSGKSAAQIKAEKAAKAKQLAIAKAKAKKQEAQRRKDAEARERRLAKQRKEESAKRQAAAKLAALEEKRKRASAQQQAVEATKSIADFSLDQELIDGRETREIRQALVPICQEIIDNEASVVLHTRTLQDYRWLTVRLTLCVRRIDKGFRLRHSHKLVADTEPSVSLHPGRSMSLLKKRRS